jgi:hypothetical protein
MSFKIQINSLQALERLIGGDSEMEIQVRGSIIKQFERKYFEEPTSNLVITNMIDKKISSFFLTNPDAYQKSLKGEVIKEIDKNIDLKYRLLISELISKHFNESRVNELIEQKAKWVADELCDIVLSKRFDEQVDIEIKKRLGIK